MDVPITSPRGLGSAEASARLAADGPNALPRATTHGVAALALSVLREPMFVLLLMAAGIYLALGDLGDALVLAASIVAILAITVVQERRTQRALEALGELSSPHALVLRDGVEKRIPGAEVVRGDLLILREGDRVAADGVVSNPHAFEVDESLATGESLPVRKPAASSVVSGSLVVRGSAAVQVTATGPRSELGRIGVSLATIEGRATPLQVETARMVRRMAVLALALCLLFALAFATLRGDGIGGILAGLTLAMSLLPEEFPVVLTVFLALGAWRIAKHGVLTRRMPVIEALGSATVLCCDKTGTLTENRMTVASTWEDGGWRAPDRGAERLLGIAALACDPAGFDPMDRAILAAAAPRGRRPHPEKRHALTEGFLAVAHGYRDEHGAHLAMKGAPETVIGLAALDPASRERILAAAAEAAARGMRVLAVADARWNERAWPHQAAAHDWRFAGLIAFADPVRASAPAAVAQCRRAGIRVVMITGDHAATARAIARECGIDADTVVTGAQLTAMDDEALAARVGSVQVYARVRPEQKLRLVNALRASGEVVAMTGDGVNDAPALKAADIGIAMGGRGTDVAREAAALILVDDDFAAIPGAVQLGRRIYDNIRNAMRYLVAVHVPLAGVAFVPLVAGWPLLLLPVHVVFLEFVIDPACSLVFEAERGDPRAMDRPPRPQGEPLFTRASLTVAALLGASVLAAVTLALAAAHAAGLDEFQSRTVAFVALVAGNLALIVANRSARLTTVEALRNRNTALWSILAGACAALAVAIYVPAAATLFRFSPPPAAWLALAALGGAGSIAWFDLYKLFKRRGGPGLRRRMR
jgi:Ca2+-transporting ATPase